MRNIEIKARIKDPLSIIEKAKKLSGTSGEIIHQHDTFYNSVHGRLKLRRFKDDTGELIFYDRLDELGPKLSTYDKHVVEEAKSLETLNKVLLQSLGCKGIVKKTRHLFIVGQTRVHVDFVENLGDFIELEVALNDDQTLEDGQRVANELMQELDVKCEDLLCGAYRDLMSK